MPDRDAARPGGKRETRMPSHRIRWFAALLVLMILLPTCSSDDKSTTPEPPKLITVQGSIAPPDGSSIVADDLTVLCGDRTCGVDSSGAFQTSVWNNAPAALVAVDASDNPVLMAVVCDPVQNPQPILDAHSTALALVYLNPMVCHCTPGGAASILASIAALPSLAILADTIEQRLQINPLTLTIDDPVIDQLLTDVVEEYVNDDSWGPAPVALATDRPPASGQAAQSGPIIQPDYERSGHRLNWLGGSSYEITNSYGRWAYCCTPTDSFYLFPNGDFLDWIRKGQPWPPSKRKLTLSVTVAETTIVNIFGYGCLGAADNNWVDLTEEEKLRAHYGGFVTVTFELVTHLLGVVCNTARVTGNDAIASRIGESIIGPIFQDGRVYQRVAAYMQANDPWGCTWFLSKEVLKKVVMSPSYRETFCIITGITLTDGAIRTLASWLAVPAKVTLTFNSVSSAFKTALALNSARYKTTFKVWKEINEFGVIEGMIADKTSGLGIAGATVTIGGDDNNPMNPPHQKATDADGHFRFENIGVGERTVTATATGYRSNSTGVTVVKNATVTANLELERLGAGVSGYIRNDIFIHYGQPSTLFKGSVNIHCRQIGGLGETRDTWADDGVLSLSLLQGTWWVIASHDDYDPDSVQVTVPSEGTVALPRDLLLKPHPTMTGRIYINTDNTGSYEIDFVPIFNQIGLTAEVLYNGSCPLGGSPALLLDCSAVRGTTNASYDAVAFSIRVDAVPEAGAYRLGGVDTYGCTGAVPFSAAAAAFVTTRATCAMEGIPQTFPLQFTFIDDPESAGCNCGITQPGDIFLTEWSTELGEVVAGGFNLDLAGWTTCECSGDDSDDDGVIDTWEVDCAQARLQLDFRLPVGSDYLVTFTPGGAQAKLPQLLR